MKQSRYYTILLTVVVSTLTISFISLFAYLIITDPNAQQVFVEKTTDALASAILILVRSLCNNSSDFIIF